MPTSAEMLGIGICRWIIKKNDMSCFWNGDDLKKGGIIMGRNKSTQKQQKKEKIRRKIQNADTKNVIVIPAKPRVETGHDLSDDGVG